MTKTFSSSSVYILCMNIAMSSNNNKSNFSHDGNIILRYCSKTFRVQTTVARRTTSFLTRQLLYYVAKIRSTRLKIASNELAIHILLTQGSSHNLFSIWYFQNLHDLGHDPKSVTSIFPDLPDQAFDILLRYEFDRYIGQTPIKNLHIPRSKILIGEYGGFWS
jgi:hypothetical protein